jgi:hypothetical protein
MLGGHSLLLIQLVSRLRQTFELSIPLGAVMDVRTIAGQAERIEMLQWNTGDVVSSSSRLLDAREEFEI